MFRAPGKEPPCASLTSTQPPAEHLDPSWRTVLPGRLGGLVEASASDLPAQPATLIG